MVKNKEKCKRNDRDIIDTNSIGIPIIILYKYNIIIGNIVLVVVL